MAADVAGTQRRVRQRGHDPGWISRLPPEAKKTSSGPQAVPAPAAPDRLPTTNFKLSAKTVADVYKSRWEVELFFKWIKQNLRIKSFVGTSRNAVTTQLGSRCASACCSRT